MATVAGTSTVAPVAAPPKSHGLTERAKAERKLGLMLVMPSVVVMILVAGFPILYAIWLSLHRADLRFPNLTAWIGLDNYISVLSSHTWWSDFFNTVIITVFSVALELVLGLLIAEAMYRALYARTWIRVAVLVPYGAVTVVSAFAWSLAFNPATGFATQWLGLSTPPLTTRAGSFAVIILSDVWKTTPFISLLMLGALALVPEDLYKAAKVDGATAWQRFWRITIPLIKPALAVAVLFRVLDAFRIYDSVYIITNGSNNTASVSLLG
ncbi:MAG: carbohydrate ABC transporter permease, partial [Solirubrobacteraceae bacterium]